MTTRIGLGTILGPLRHLPSEIIARIKQEADLTKRLKKINRWVNLWVSDVDTWMTADFLDGSGFLFWIEHFARVVMDVKRYENGIRRLRE